MEMSPLKSAVLSTALELDVSIKLFGGVSFELIGEVPFV